MQNRTVAPPTTSPASPSETELLPGLVALGRLIYTRPGIDATPAQVATWRRAARKAVA